MSYINSFKSFLMDIWKSKRLILGLTGKDFKIRYLGSYLGILWAFIQPIITIFIFWLVFQVGFKTSPAGNFPYVLWFMTGIIPWLFFSESVSAATYSIVSNTYLVKKIVFRVSVLPIIKIMSVLIIHVFFVLIIFLMFAFYRFTPNIYYFQVVYYLCATIMLVVGISWITSSLQVFLADTAQLVATAIQFGFWLTPIFWSDSILPLKYKLFIKINPVFYIIQGYRDSFIYKIGFWNYPRLTIYFWFVTTIIFVSGAMLFKRLRPHFADVI